MIFEYLILDKFLVKIIFQFIVLYEHYILHELNLKKQNKVPTSSLVRNNDGFWLKLYIQCKIRYRK